MSCATQGESLHSSVLYLVICKTMTTQPILRGREVKRSNPDAMCPADLVSI